MKTRKVIGRLHRQSNQARQATPPQDMASGLLRLALMGQCSDFMNEIIPVLRQLGTIGKNLDGYVRSVPTMPEPEVRQGLQNIVKARAALKGLSAVANALNASPVTDVTAGPRRGN